MRIKLIVGIVIAGCLFSCGRNAQKNRAEKSADIAGSTKDTLVYTYKDIKERALDCGNRPDSACTVATITYPFFLNQNLLNDSVSSKLTHSYFTGEPDSTIQQQAKSFIKYYENDTVGKANHTRVSYMFESNIAVIRQDSSLITIQIDRYASAPHPSEYSGFLNWNTKANKKIELSDIFINGYRDKLTSIGEKIFRMQEKLSDTSSLSNYPFENGKFMLNDNYLITPTGIHFLYNESVVKPHSDGPTELLIPYVQIKQLLRPNTVISQYIKK
jgi:Protein of unknown function (DUF3298)